MPDNTDPRRASSMSLGIAKACTAPEEHTSAYVSIRRLLYEPRDREGLHSAGGAYVSIRRLFYEPRDTEGLESAAQRQYLYFCTSKASKLGVP